MSTPVLISLGIASGVAGTALCWLVWRIIKVISDAEGYR